MKRYFSLFAIAFLAATPLYLRAQALPTASARGGTIQVGGEYSIQNDDYDVGNGTRIQGISAYGTFDFSKHIGVEAAYRSLRIKTPSDIGETALEAGLRYVYPVHRYRPFIRAMIGDGGFIATRNYNPNYIVGTGHYSEYSFGGGLDILLSHHINIRAVDFEQQVWPKFQTNGLTPTTLSFGVAYRFR